MVGKLMGRTRIFGGCGAVMVISLFVKDFQEREETGGVESFGSVGCAMHVAAIGEERKLQANKKEGMIEQVSVTELAELARLNWDHGRNGRANENRGEADE